MLNPFSLTRIFTSEIMDSPDISPRKHRQALAGLRRINKVSGVCPRIVRLVLDLAQRANLRQISWIDVACGGGDVPIMAGEQLQKQSIEVALTLLDKSQTALAQAAQSAVDAGIPCRTISGNAGDVGKLPPADVVTSTLFLHHLREETEVVELLRNMRQATRHMIVISDLRRSALGWVGAWIGCRLLSRSPIVHFDGPTSVRAAWTIEEVKKFAHRAGMENAIVYGTRPWRWLLVWNRAN